MTVSITLLIIIVTAIISFIGFRDRAVIDKLIFYPPAIAEQNQWYRFFTCGFIHKDIPHLIFNMYALFIFGQGQSKNGVEFIFRDEVFGESGRLLYVELYVFALGACLIPTYLKNKHNDNYMSLGASGAVSAVVFAYILLNPLQGVGLIFIPVYIPGFLFGILYLVISYWLSKKGGGNINHSAHIWGGLFGVLFLIVTSKLFSPEPVLDDFVNAIKHFRLDNLFQVN
jgi:membrane associated rhomboid family serine protease